MFNRRNFTLATLISGQLVVPISKLNEKVVNITIIPLTSVIAVNLVR